MTSNTWVNLLKGEDSELVVRHAADLEHYAAAAPEAALAVLAGSGRNHLATHELARAWGERLPPLRAIAVLDGALIGWTQELLRAATAGAIGGAHWDVLLRMGSALLLDAAVHSGSSVPREWMLSLPSDGFSLHVAGETILPVSDGSACDMVSDGVEYRRSPLARFPVGRFVVSVDASHAVVKKCFLAGYEFPYSLRGNPLGAFPHHDELHDEDIGALRSGLTMITEFWPFGATLVGCFGRSFMPVHAPTTSQSLSVSSQTYPGWVVASLDTPLYMAECMIHESSHNLLYELMRKTVLVTPEAEGMEIWYSPWRPDPRPITGLLHAAFVFANVINLYSRIAQGNQSPDLGLSRRRLGAELERTTIAIEVLHNSNGLTMEGEHLVTALAERIRLAREQGYAELDRDDARELLAHRTDWERRHGKLNR